MRIALISDIHEDIVSLRRAIRKAEKLKCDDMVCLGDISGFSAPHYDYYNTRNASECLKLVRSTCSAILAGNHDLHAARVTPKINPEFEYPKNWYENDFYEKLEISKENVWLYDNDELDAMYHRADIEFIKSLPENYIYKLETCNILMTHYCYPNLTGSMKSFYNYIEDFEEHQDYMEKNRCIYSFVGHRHFAGMLIATKSQMVSFRFGKKHKLNKGDCVFVPAIANNKAGNGFCIYNTDNNTVEAIRL